MATETKVDGRRLTPHPTTSRTLNFLGTSQVYSRSRSRSRSRFYSLHLSLSVSHTVSLKPRVELIPWRQSAYALCGAAPGRCQVPAVMGTSACQTQSSTAGALLSPIFPCTLVLTSHTHITHTHHTYTYTQETKETKEAVRSCLLKIANNTQDCLHRLS